MMVSSRRGRDGMAGWLVAAVVAQHRPEHVEAAAGQGGQGPSAGSCSARCWRQKSASLGGRLSRWSAEVR
jgi:hypothetical protein